MTLNKTRVPSECTCLFKLNWCAQTLISEDQSLAVSPGQTWEVDLWPLSPSLHLKLLGNTEDLLLCPEMNIIAGKLSKDLIVCGQFLIKQRLQYTVQLPHSFILHIHIYMTVSRANETTIGPFTWPVHDWSVAPVFSTVWYDIYLFYLLLLQVPSLLYTLCWCFFTHSLVKFIYIVCVCNLYSAFSILEHVDNHVGDFN